MQSATIQIIHPIVIYSNLNFGEISRGNPEILSFPRGNQSFLKIHAVTLRFTQLILRDLFTQKTFVNVSLLRIKHGTAEAIKISLFPQFNSPNITFPLFQPNSPIS